MIAFYFIVCEMLSSRHLLHQLPFTLTLACTCVCVCLYICSWFFLLAKNDTSHMHTALYNLPTCVSRLLSMVSVIDRRVDWQPTTRRGGGGGRRRRGGGRRKRGTGERLRLCQLSRTWKRCNTSDRGTSHHGHTCICM